MGPVPEPEVLLGAVHAVRERALDHLDQGPRSSRSPDGASLRLQHLHRKTGARIDERLADARFQGILAANVRNAVDRRLHFRPLRLSRHRETPPKDCRGAIHQR